MMKKTILIARKLRISKVPPMAGLTLVEYRWYLNNEKAIAPGRSHELRYTFLKKSTKAEIFF